MVIEQELERTLRSHLRAIILQDEQRLHETYASLQGFDHREILELVHRIGIIAILLEFDSRPPDRAQIADLCERIGAFYSEREGQLIELDQLLIYLHLLAGDPVPDSERLADPDRDFQWSSMIVAYLLQYSGRAWNEHLDQIEIAVERPRRK